MREFESPRLKSGGVSTASSFTYTHKGIHIMPIAAQTKHTRAAIFLTENSIEIERKPDGFIVRFGKEPTPGMLGPPPSMSGQIHTL